MCVCDFSLLEGLGNVFGNTGKNIPGGILKKKQNQKLVVHLDTRNWEFRDGTQPFSEKCLSLA